MTTTNTAPVWANDYIKELDTLPLNVFVACLQRNDFEPLRNYIQADFFTVDSNVYSLVPNHALIMRNITMNEFNHLWLPVLLKYMVATNTGDDREIIRVFGGLLSLRLEFFTIGVNAQILETNKTLSSPREFFAKRYGIDYDSEHWMITATIEGIAKKYNRLYAEYQLLKPNLSLGHFLRIIKTYSPGCNANTVFNNISTGEFIRMQLSATA